MLNRIIAIAFIFSSAQAYIDATPSDDLHQAILDDSQESIKNALAAGADINSGLGGQSPLLLSLIMQKYKAAEQLLRSGANPNITFQGEPLLYRYLKSGLVFNWMTYALDKDTMLTQSQKDEIITKILSANSFDNQIVFDVLKKLGFDVKANSESYDLKINKWYNLLNNTNQSFLNPYAIELFLNNGANPNAIFNLDSSEKWTPLLLIIKYCIQDIIKNEQYSGNILQFMRKAISALINHGADIDLAAYPEGVESNALSFAIIKDPYGDIVRMLQENKASLDKAIEIYLKGKANPNAYIKIQDVDLGIYPITKCSLLMWAILQNAPKAVDMLLKAGAYPGAGITIRRDASDTNGTPLTALQYAIRKGYEDIMNLLIAAGAKA